MMKGGPDTRPALPSSGARVSEQLLEDVLPAAQAGQAWALRAVYDQLAPRVHAYLRSRGSAEPEDLTSEVFLAVFPRLASITGGAAGLRTFTFSVAHARLVDDLRKRSRREPSTQYDAATDPRTTSSSEDDALARLQTERVRRLLDGLAPDQRDVLSLRILGDLTVDQVAETLGKSSGAVKQLQRRGLLALRRILEAAPGDPDGVTL
ncbi:MAG: polymerase subunit sigma-70 [Frankiales bacterium]|nr:polymerase subunit sigma-70 [Frankiales bacterium]